MSAEAGEISEPQLSWAKWVQFWREVWGLGAHWWQDGGKVVKALVTCSPEGPYASVPPPGHPFLSSALAFLRNASPHPPALLTAPTYSSILPTVSLRWSPLPPCSMGICLGIRVSGFSPRAPNPKSSGLADGRRLLLGRASTESPLAGRMACGH